MTMLFKNNASSRLKIGADAITTSIQLYDGEGSRFPSPAAGDYFLVTLDDRRTGRIEICKCTSRSGDFLTVVRGQEGTAAQVFDPGAVVSNRLTAASMDLFASPSRVVMSDGPPAAPAHGQMWWESDTGNLYAYYDDLTSAQWVQIVAPVSINVADVSGAPVTATGATTSRSLADHMADMVFVEDYGAAGDGVTDDSAAFQAALTSARYVCCKRKATPYLIKNIDITSGKTLDIQRAQIRPAPGANYCVRLTGSNAKCINGDWVDSASNLLKQTTLTANAIVGATTVTVASTAGFYVEGLIVIVSDDINGVTGPWGGAAQKVNHCLVSAIAGNVLTLTEPIRFAASSGKRVFTSLGFIVSEADGGTVSDHTAVAAPLFGTLRSTPAGSNYGRITWSNIEGSNMLLGGILTIGSMSSCSYNNIRFYLGYPTGTEPFQAAFGMKVDGSLAVSTRGGHHFVRCDVLGSQEGFDNDRSDIQSYTDCYADGVVEAGWRIRDASMVFLTAAWSSFNGKGISISKASSDIHIWSMWTDCRSTNAPWGQDIDLEVSDDCALIFVSRQGWRKSRKLRVGAGWMTASDIVWGPDISYLEAGAVGAPGLAFRVDPTTGLFQSSPGRIGFAVSGATHTTFTTTAAAFNQPVRLPSYTVAGSPSAATAAAGAIIYQTDTAKPAFSNGTAWAPIGGAVAWADITGKPVTFPPTLPIAQSDVTGLTTALSGKEPTISGGTTAQYWRGDKSWQTLDKAAVGLTNVDNTADSAKPVSTAQATADALALLKAGGTMTGDLLVSKTLPIISIDKAASGDKGSINFRTGTNIRWEIASNTTAETANAGSNFSIGRYNDAGTLLDTPISLSRSTGIVSTTAIVSSGNIVANNGVAIPAGGTTGLGFRFSSATNFGLFFGSGAPTLSAAKGSLYLNSTATTNTTRMYVNTDGATAWTGVNTVA